jgi:four helix bundle protein
MKENNIIIIKTYNFALRIIKLRKYLVEEIKEFDISRQVLRSGTSIGANVEEAIGGHSKKDFKAKMEIAYKEARETSYWIRLLKDSDYLVENLANSLLVDCDEILKIIGSIIKSTKKKLEVKNEMNPNPQL